MKLKNPPCEWLIFRKEPSEVLSHPRLPRARWTGEDNLSPGGKSLQHLVERLPGPQCPLLKPVHSESLTLRRRHWDWSRRLCFPRPESFEDEQWTRLIAESSRQRRWLGVPHEHKVTHGPLRITQLKVRDAYEEIAFVLSVVPRKQVVIDLVRV